MNKSSTVRRVSSYTWDQDKKGFRLVLSPCGHAQFSGERDDTGYYVRTKVRCLTCEQVQDESNGYGTDRKSYQG